MTQKDLLEVVPPFIAQGSAAMVRLLELPPGDPGIAPHRHSGPVFSYMLAVPQRRRRRDPDTARYRPLSRNQKDVNAAPTRRRGPSERVNAELKNWRILRKIPSNPNTADELIAAVQTLVIDSA